VYVGGGWGRGYRYFGFVLQDDVLLAHLTVRESLRFAVCRDSPAVRGLISIRSDPYIPTQALLRLPRTWSARAKDAQVDHVIALLRLGKCADSKIGSPWQRGISGGRCTRAWWLCADAYACVHSGAHCPAAQVSASARALPLSC
jgi:hypothetical protein